LEQTVLLTLVEAVEAVVVVGVQEVKAALAL
jgi:hypothetical protein